MEGNFTLKSGKYIYDITYIKRGGLPRTGLTKIKKITSRKNIRYFFDKRDDLIKLIIYPEELWTNEISFYDPVEKYINEIIDFIPDFKKIEIKNSN